MARLLKSEAIVLKKRSLPSKDSFITLLSQDRGKIHTIAKGIKKITSRRLAHVQTGNLVQVNIHRKNERYSLQETTLISAFSQIKKSSQKLNLMYFFLYAVERLLPENQQEPEIYLLVKKFLIDLARTEKFSVKHLEDYIYHLLFHLGYTQSRISLSAQRSLIQELTNEEMPSFVI